MTEPLAGDGGGVRFPHCTDPSRKAERPASATVAALRLGREAPRVRPWQGSDGLTGARGLG